jgi:hypothetical protein
MRISIVERPLRLLEMNQPIAGYAPGQAKRPPYNSAGRIGCATNSWACSEMTYAC